MSTGPLGGQSSALGHSNVTEKMNFLGHRVPLTQEVDHEGGGRKCHDYKPKGPQQEVTSQRAHAVEDTTVPSAYENQKIINTL